MDICPDHACGRVCIFLLPGHIGTNLLISIRLTAERRDYLSGRYLSVHWDANELEAKKDEILKGDKLKFKMAV